jgi:tRNA(adenine34) deaminase
MLQGSIIVIPVHLGTCNLQDGTVGAEKVMGSSVDEKWMGEAMKEARMAAEEDEVPVGCVIVSEDRVIGRGHNRVEALQDPTAHAEVIAIGSAARSLNSRRLTGCTLYVNIEPCSMCAGAVVLSRMSRLVYGARDPKGGACGSVLDIVGNPDLNHRVEVVGRVLEEECRGIIQKYFEKKRST